MLSAQGIPSNLLVNSRLDEVDQVTPQQPKHYHIFQIQDYTNIIPVSFEQNACNENIKKKNIGNQGLKNYHEVHTLRKNYCRKMKMRLQKLTLHDHCQFDFGDHHCTPETAIYDYNPHHVLLDNPLETLHGLNASLGKESNHPALLVQESMT